MKKGRVGSARWRTDADAKAALSFSKAAEASEHHGKGLSLLVSQRCSDGGVVFDELAIKVGKAKEALGIDVGSTRPESSQVGVVADLATRLSACTFTTFARVVDAWEDIAKEFLPDTALFRMPLKNARFRLRGTDTLFEGVCFLPGPAEYDPLVGDDQLEEEEITFTVNPTRNPAFPPVASSPLPEYGSVAKGTKRPREDAVDGWQEEPLEDDTDIYRYAQIVLMRDYMSIVTRADIFSTIDACHLISDRWRGRELELDGIGLEFE
ncbi:hypothetical protein BDK51DRAFT_48260 [Blyttiomyces helicus]|uniref:Uncharacterized protein n=1 Tax=Blyttiomyces helicus TaxID=388810 RepID=A0A4P9W813_9FUNG|nr:hypothetical protein BDK51DRAFT_48260 [Blyttiomyces helicus]|eukprot:RKO88641.1 hypothetical protein BDK51DRAFT_48260 [Blyttiomyces helicus]